MLKFGPPMRERAPSRRIPFIDLTPLVAELKDEALSAFAAQLDHCEFVEGPTVARLEQVLSSELGLPHAVACSNGTDALVLALRALGVQPGHKVALPDLTFWASYEAVVELGAIPVLVDIDADDLQMSFAKFVEASQRLELDAAVLVHLFGWASARVADFRSFARERGIRLVEDAAQAYGVRSGGAPLLAGADAAAISFFPGKVIGAPMDAGAVLFQSEQAAALARSLKNHGRTGHYSHAHIGYNSRMAAMAASYLLAVCARSKRILAARRAVAAGYRARIGSKGLRIFGPPPGVEDNGYLSVVTSERDDGERLATELERRGIGCARFYPAPIHAQTPAKGALRGSELVESARFCRRVVNLPLYYGIAEADWQCSADVLLELSEAR
jgi:UDP-2-acetamido-2-deoxy-ribo-hexuluronate aminotransferase